jgi:hypothetical protein
MQYVVKPNLKKVYLFTLLKVCGLLAALIAVVLYLHIIVGLGVFAEIFKDFGISPWRFVLFIVVMVLAATLVMFLLSYLGFAKVDYIFYNDRFTVYQNILVFNIGKREIPYKDISNTYYDESNLIGIIFKTGTITFELIGKNKGIINLKFIDNAKEVFSNIQNIIKQYKLNQNGRTRESERIVDILEK